MRRGPGFRAAVITSVLAAAALVLLLPQPAYAAAPWDLKGAVEEAIKGWLLDGACGFFNMYNGLVSAIGDNGILTAPFSSLLGESVYSITVTVHQTAVARQDIRHIFNAQFAFELRLHQVSEARAYHQAKAHDRANPGFAFE